jgi:hypothetical protein
VIVVIHEEETAIISIDKNGEIRSVCDDGFNQ